MKVKFALFLVHAFFLNTEPAVESRDWGREGGEDSEIESAWEKEKKKATFIFPVKNRRHVADRILIQFTDLSSSEILSGVISSFFHVRQFCTQGEPFPK